MKPLSVPLVNENNLNIEAVELSPGTARVIFNGVLTLRDPAPVLQPFFDRLHTALAEHLYRRVKVDLRGLRFMNSASFKHVVSWIKANNALPPDRRYVIEFILNPTHAWQKTSIHALRPFSTDRILIEGEAF